jgi:hypothetical protein
MKKIGISTVYTGYNYGSALQAYATKAILEKLGYEGVILHLDGSILPGRDVRLIKLAGITCRAILHPKIAKRSIGAYKNSIAIEYPDGANNLFDLFVSQQLQPNVLKWNALKKAALRDDYAAFICGSDQIWNADTYYVDPFYYLTFAPEYKRVAFTPSFGRDLVPKYNDKIISKYLSGIPYLSVREASGAAIIATMINKSAAVLIDPTLVLSKDDWCSLFDLSTPYLNYLLAYFLNEPSDEYKNAIREIAYKNGLRIIGIPYLFQNGDFVDEIHAAGPVEFMKLIKNASVVCTDSFHGTAFSLNFGVPFYSFERNYGTAGKQSSRILSLLDLTETEHRFCTSGELSKKPIDFLNAANILKSEKQKSIEYLTNSISGVIAHEQ